MSQSFVLNNLHAFLSGSHCRAEMRDWGSRALAAVGLEPDISAVSFPEVRIRTSDSSRHNSAAFQAGTMYDGVQAGSCVDFRDGQFPSESRVTFAASSTAILGDLLCGGRGRRGRWRLRPILLRRKSPRLPEDFLRALKIFTATSQEINGPAATAGGLAPRVVNHEQSSR